MGPDLEPKLLDFGLALDLGGRERLSQAGEIAGTPEYLSPEQAAGVQELDARSDVFSLGAVLYEVLTGDAAFRRRNASPDCCANIRTRRPGAAAPPQSGDPPRPAEYLPQGAGKRRRRALRLRARDG